jgi:pimeloyl-ACP methyl ester carboxylesterase
MGAGVASLAAGTFPERISHLVLIEGLGPFAEPDEKAPRQLAKALLHSQSRRRRIYGTRTEAVERLASRGLKPESAECLAARSLEEVEGGWAFTYAPGVRAPSRLRFSEDQVRAFLRAITCPTLLILASDGLEMPPAYRERTSEVQRIQVVVKEGGHHLHLDHPERVGPAIQEFFKVSAGPNRTD